MTNVLLCLLWELVSKVSPLFFLFFYRRKWYLEAQTGCPAARPDCEPPPNTVKWLKLIQDPESSAVFFFPLPCSSSFRRLQEKKRGTQWFPSGVSQTQTDYLLCETISKCVLRKCEQCLCPAFDEVDLMMPVEKKQTKKLISNENYLRS